MRHHRCPARVVDEQVEPAEALHGLVDERASLLSIADVSPEVDGAGDRGGDRLTGFHRVRRVDDDGCAEAAKASGDRLADPARRTGDDRDVAREFS